MQESNVETPIRPPPTMSQPRPSLRRFRRGLLRDLFEMIVLVVVIYTFVNLTTARAIVEGPSMQPNFVTNQLVIVNLFSYYFNPPARGDVVVIRNPETNCKGVVKQGSGLALLLPAKDDGVCDDYIKRVMGLPGETLVIDAKGRVSINGVMLEEPYIEHFCERGDCTGTWMLGADQYFVMGDNRPASRDSHSFGPIDRTLIVGQAWIRYWPLPVFQIVPHPSYGPIPTSNPALPTFTPTPGHIQG